MTINEMIHEIPHMRYRLESAKHKETLDEIEEVLRHYKEQDDDLISRQAVLDGIDTYIYKAQSTGTQDDFYSFAELVVKQLPSVNPQEPKTGHCKDCKHFEYDSVAKVDGIPLIIAHEICNRWGDGCKTREDGYCFLFEPQESEDKR